MACEGEQSDGGRGGRSVWEGEEKHMQVVGNDMGLESGSKGLDVPVLPESAGASGQDSARGARQARELARLGRNKATAALRRIAGRRARPPHSQCRR